MPPKKRSRVNYSRSPDHSLYTLVSNDGVVMEIEKSVASLSKTITNMLSSGEDETLALPSVNGEVLALVMDYCKEHTDTVVTAGVTEEAKLPSEKKADLEKWDREFVNDVEEDKLFDLILAANYLDIKNLLDLMCWTVVNKSLEYTQRDLPPEIVGKIVGMACVPYNRERLDELGLNKDQLAYANVALRQMEEEWGPLIQVVKETLTRLQTHLVDIEGGANRFHPHVDPSPPHAARLMTCWPRYWVFDDVTDAIDLCSEIADVDGSTMDTDMCQAVAGPLEYCYSTPRHHDCLEQDAKMLTVFVPQDRLHPTVTSASMEFNEALVDHYENYEGHVNTLSRSFCLAVRFVGGEQYKISVYKEQCRHPDHYMIRPGWVSTKPPGYADFMPDHSDREKKGPIGPHAGAVVLIMRQLLLKLDQARPFTYFAVDCSREWKEKMISVGIHRLGVPELLTKL